MIEQSIECIFMFLFPNDGFFRWLVWLMIFELPCKGDVMLLGMDGMNGFSEVPNTGQKVHVLKDFIEV